VLRGGVEMSHALDHQNVEIQLLLEAIYLQDEYDFRRTVKLHHIPQGGKK
jgi:hypothetical protein